ncbi:MULTISPECIES: UPF0182 family membrane protein [unclassified Sedimentibacter]|uniref:UPF0182 family membrane protein n=1 Tax=unclassified Sedimentibacter TaxID=2649220 RepID=UPI0027DEC7D4|nr:UPF0182 family protein [Sedimentibacter sp. MB35-C1]WMJ78000.1 UPF0182 family protein [Sedimentibacter sp. MB35-C1]
MRNRGRFFVIGLIIIVFLAVNSFGGVIKFLTDYSWFKEVGYTETFLTKIKAQFAIGIPVFFLLSILLYVFIRKLKKKYDLESGVIDTQSKKKSLMWMKIISVAISFLFTVSVVSGTWFQILQFFNSESFGVVDPIFNNDMSFYIFKLPLINTLIDFVMNILFLLIVVTVLFYGYLTIKDSLKNVTEQFTEMKFNNYQFDFSAVLNVKFASKIINQLSVIGIFVFVLLGVKFVLRSYELLYSQLGRVFGAGYTDINVTLNLYRILAIGCLISAVTFFMGARKRNLKFALTMPVALIVISIAGTGLAGLVENFVVEPDQLSKETKYMEYSIKSTQSAYALDDVKIVQFPATNELTIEDINNNKEVIDNIRINDQEPLIQVYNQLQGIRPYYVFNDVDVDRYNINGDYKQVFLSARELDQNRLNDQARTWVNQYLKYTHGYGITLSQVNEVTSQGQPEMLMKNIPPITSTDLKITRPEIYFGESTNDYIIVNSDEKEFDYPSGSDNVETLYEGEAGIKLSFVNKLLFSLREASYRLFISNNINSDSRILLNRNIMQRVYEIASFMYFDNDAYIVINQDDGKLYWIIEGFTVSDKFAYSQPTDKFIEGWNVNYIRNSVKAVIDAYDGSVDFYISDETDPIIKTYSKIFTDLFKPMSEMPEGLKSHIRYSQAYFDVQSDMYRLYHIENPTVFFGREDYWDIANEKYMNNGEQPIGSNYVMFKLPEEDDVEFLLTTQYTPQNKDNMIALLAARNDGEAYGDLVLYEFPKTKTIPGPSMMETKIDQDTVISSQLTLWSQVGSTVLRGNTVVVPIEESLLYVEPIYLKSDTESNFPEMKMVVVYYDEKIIMESTLEKAIEKIFGIYTEEEQPVEEEYEYDDTNINDLIKQATQFFNEATEASQKGDWSSYGDSLENLEEVLERLNLLTNTAQSTNENNTPDGNVTENKGTEQQ